MHRSSSRDFCGAVAVRVISSAILAGTAASCGGGDSSGNVGPDGKVHQGVNASGTLTVSPTSLTLVQGRSVTATLTLALTGASPGTIAFATTGTAPGVSATFNPPSLSASGSTTVTFTAASDANIVTGASVYFVGLVGTDTLLLDGLSPHIDYVVRNARPSVSVVKAGSGTGTVTSSPSGINCGTSCSAVFDLGPITLTAAPAAGSALASWSGLCVGTGPTCTFTPNDFGNIVTATFTSTVPAISLAASPSPVSVPTGGSGTSTVTFTRVNGYADPINLAITAPTGLTVTANPASVSGTTSTLAINAASSLAAGSYSATITATGNGVTQQSITLPIQVTIPASGGAITFNYASCDPSRVPLWFAAQNGSGPWTRVTPSSNAFTFTMGSTGAYALVQRNGADTVTTVLYASATEIAAIASANPCGTDPQMGTKRINGSMLNAGSVANGLVSSVIIGGAQYSRPNDSTNNFTLTTVPNGSRDLIATTQNNRASTGVNLTRMLIRRNTNYANNQTISSVDLTGAESFSPPLEVLTPLNLGGDQISVNASLITANGPSVEYYSTKFLGPAGNTGFQGLPDSLIRPGDFHNVSILAAPASGNAFRFAALLVHSLNTTSPTTISFGPAVSGVSVTSVATAPYLRLRGQVASQGTYSAGGVADFTQGNRSVSVIVTAGYLGSAPTTWTMDIPDFSVASYDPAWALKSAATSWEVDAVAGDALPYLGGNPFNNAQVIVAGAANQAASFSVSRAFRPARRLRRLP